MKLLIADVFGRQEPFKPAPVLADLAPVLYGQGDVHVAARGEGVGGVLQQ